VCSEDHLNQTARTSVENWRLESFGGKLRDQSLNTGGHNLFDPPYFWRSYCRIWGVSVQDQEDIRKQLYDTAMLDRWRLKECSVWGIALLSFVTGSLISARFVQSTVVRADSKRIFELMIYHAKPGKVAELESIFRDVSKLQAKHNLTLSVIGYPTMIPLGKTHLSTLWLIRVWKKRRKIGMRFIPTQPFCPIGRLRRH